jgi:hypothetical protein
MRWSQHKRRYADNKQYFPHDELRRAAACRAPNNRQTRRILNRPGEPAAGNSGGSAACAN